jgi:site-specific DNA-methyltransferase (adenine-specific)
MPLLPKISSKKTNSKVQLYKEDAIKFLDNLNPNSIDLMITDPAYESLEKHRSVGTTTRLKNKWFQIFKNEYFNPFFKSVFRVMKNNSHLYMFCDQETMFYIKPLGEEVGFTFHKPIVWDKIAISTGYHWRNTYEFILFFEKGKRHLNNKSWSDVQHVKRLKGKKYYATQKPVELIEKLIINSSNKYELIADPFMGSGSVGEAAIKNDRRFIGSDIEEDAYEIATERLCQKNTER